MTALPVWETANITNTVANQRGAGGGAEKHLRSTDGVHSQSLEDLVATQGRVGFDLRQWTKPLIIFLMLF